MIKRMTTGSIECNRDTGTLNFLIVNIEISGNTVAIRLSRNHWDLSRGKSLKRRKLATFANKKIINTKFFRSSIQRRIAIRDAIIVHVLHREQQFANTGTQVCRFRSVSRQISLASEVASRSHIKFGNDCLFRNRRSAVRSSHNEAFQGIGQCFQVILIRARSLQFRFLRFGCMFIVEKDTEKGFVICAVRPMCFKNQTIRPFLSNRNKQMIRKSDNCPHRMSRYNLPAPVHILLASNGFIWQDCKKKTTGAHLCQRIVDELRFLLRLDREGRIHQHSGERTLVVQKIICSSSPSLHVTISKNKLVIKTVSVVDMTLSVTPENHVH